MEREATASRNTLKRPNDVMRKEVRAGSLEKLYATLPNIEYKEGNQMKKSLLVLLTVVAVALFGYACKNEQSTTTDTGATATDTGMSSTSSTMSSTDTAATGTTGTMSSTDTTGTGMTGTMSSTDTTGTAGTMGTMGTSGTGMTATTGTTTTKTTVKKKKS